MLEIARKHGHSPDARIGRLAEWVRANMAPGDHWNERRLLLFTEYEDTRRWVEKRLAEALDDLQADDRIASFTGATPLVRREELKRRFNADPAKAMPRDEARFLRKIVARCEMGSSGTSCRGLERAISISSVTRRADIGTFRAVARTAS
jgi:hypothetical protein